MCSPSYATDLQHLASSLPSEQSFTPSHTLLRGIQRPSPQRNWRGHAGDWQEGDLHELTGTFLNVNPNWTNHILPNGRGGVKASDLTYCPLERRLGRSSRSPCEWGIRPNGSGGREERSRLAFWCCLTLGCTIWRQITKKKNEYYIELTRSQIRTS